MFKEKEISPKAVAAANTTAGKPNEESALNIASVRPANPGIFFGSTLLSRFVMLARAFWSPSLVAPAEIFKSRF